MRYLDIYLAGFKLGINDFFSLWTVQSWFGGWMIRIICNILVWVYLGDLIGSGEKLNYLLIGNCATAGLGNFAAMVPSWERTSGTFALLVAAPNPLWIPIFGRMTIWAISWYATILLCFTLSIAFLGIPRLPACNIALVAVVLSLLCLSTLTFCAFLGAIVSAKPKLRLIAGWSLLTIIMAFTGVTTPIDVWPVEIRPALHLLPVTNGLSAIRLIFENHITGQVYLSALAELAVAIFWACIAILAFNRAVAEVKQNGKIDYSD